MADVSTRGFRTKWVLRFLVVLIACGSTVAMTACGPPGVFFTVGTVVDVLPNGFFTVSVGGGRYYYHQGVFYRRARGGFLVVHPPMGAVIMSLPPDYMFLTVSDRRYVYDYRYGVFYAPRPMERYVVVTAPDGAFVRRLPAGAVTQRIGGVEYKEYAGTYYRPATRSGRTGYEVVRRPSGFNP